MAQPAGTGRWGTGCGMLRETMCKMSHLVSFISVTSDVLPSEGTISSLFVSGNSLQKVTFLTLTLPYAYT